MEQSERRNTHQAMIRRFVCGTGGVMSEHLLVRTLNHGLIALAWPPRPLVHVR